MGFFARTWDAVGAGVRVFRAHASMPEGSRASGDPLTGPSLDELQRSPESGGNGFASYKVQVEAISRKLQNKDQYGCGPTANVVNWRAVQIAGNGINVTSKDKRTQDFLSRWVRDNQLAGARAFEIALGGELEGKILLYNEKVGDRIVVRYLPWIRWGYTVNSLAGAPDLAGTATFKDAGGTMRTLESGKFVYVRFSGATAAKDGYLLNEPPPRVASVLWRLESIDRALSDLRSNNHLYGHPVLTIETKDSNSAGILRRLFFGRDRKDQEQKTQVKVGSGKFYIVDGKVYYAEPSGAAVESIIKEVTVTAQMVSGETGIPVHLLGFPELMSNRATADDMHEMINAATAREREAIKAGILELARQACELDGGSYDLESIQVSLPVVLLSDIKRIIDVWLALYKENVLDLQSMLEKVPGIDPEKVLERLQEQRSKKLEEADAQTKSIIEQMNREREEAQL